MSTSTSTSARNTGTRGCRRTTDSPRSQALASTTMSGNSCVNSGIGGAAAGSRAASRPTVRTPISRSAAAVSPRTTRLTSCAALSSASQRGHHGQCRHSVTRDGSASAAAPPGRGGGHRPPVGEAGVVLGQCGALPGPVPAAQVVPDDHVGVHPDHPAVLGEPVGRRRGPARGVQHPVEVGQPEQVPGLRAHPARGIGPGALRPGSGTGAVSAPSPGSVIRCRTTMIGRYPPDGPGPAARPRRGGRPRRRRAAPRPR